MNAWGRSTRSLGVSHTSVAWTPRGVMASGRPTGILRLIGPAGYNQGAGLFPKLRPL